MVHSPDCILDGDLTTGWVEGRAGYGVGEIITLTLEQKALL